MAGYHPWREIRHKKLAPMTPEERAAYEKDLERMLADEKKRIEKKDQPAKLRKPR